MPNAENMTTLRDVLTQSKPWIPQSKMSSHHTPGRWPEFYDEGSIVLWDDFNLDTLNESYGHILEQAVPAEVLERLPDPDDVLGDVRIAKQADALRLVEWHDQLLGPTLDIAKTNLGLYPNMRLEHGVTAPDGSSTARVQVDKRSLKVDHKIQLDEYPTPCLVLGSARPASRFRHHQLLTRGLVTETLAHGPFDS